LRAKNILFFFVFVMLLAAQNVNSKLPNDVYEFWDTRNIEKVVFSIKHAILTEYDLETIRNNDPVRYNKIDGFARSVFFGWRLQAEEPRYKEANEKAVDGYVEYYLKLDKEFIDTFINSYINPNNREKLTNNMTYVIYENLYPKYSRVDPEKIESFYDLAQHALVLYQKVAEQLSKKISS
jgi:hypothetical protein